MTSEAQRKKNIEAFEKDVEELKAKQKPMSDKFIYGKGDLIIKKPKEKD